MSKIGSQPITIPAGVTIDVTERIIVVKGPNGELSIPLIRGIKPVREEGAIRFETTSSGKQVRSNWGTMRALVANAVQGLTKGFEKTLILDGIGFRIAKEGADLVLNLGFSHPVKFKSVPGITWNVEKNTILKIQGFDKALVGQVAAEIRGLKKPEPYKGKGFHYSDEVIRRKAGKKAASASGTAGT